MNTTSDTLECGHSLAELSAYLDTGRVRIRSTWKMPRMPGRLGLTAPPLRAGTRTAQLNVPRPAPARTTGCSPSWTLRLSCGREGTSLCSPGTQRHSVGNGRIHLRTHPFRSRRPSGNSRRQMPPARRRHHTWSRDHRGRGSSSRLRTPHGRTCRRRPPRHCGDACPAHPAGASQQSDVTAAATSWRPGFPACAGPPRHCKVPPRKPVLRLVPGPQGEAMDPSPFFPRDTAPADLGRRAARRDTSTSTASAEVSPRPARCRPNIAGAARSAVTREHLPVVQVEFDQGAPST